jgi:hypothetical protein
MALGFFVPVPALSPRHHKRHADWLCTPPDEHDALLSWEVTMTQGVVAMFAYRGLQQFWSKNQRSVVSICH